MKFKYKKYDYTGIISIPKFTFNIPCDYLVNSVYINENNELIVELNINDKIEKLKLIV